MDNKPPGSAALRRGRRSIAGQVYSITAATRGRRAYFADRGYARVAVQVLIDDSNWPSAIPLLWLLMPDHLHLLVELGAEETLARCVARIKALIALKLPPDIERRIWQPSFHDHALRREESVLHFARYILANPVRAGFVDAPEQWPWRGGRLLEAVAEELPWLG